MKRHGIELGTRAGLTALLAIVLLAGCHKTDSTIMLDPDGEDVAVTPEEIHEWSGADAPYLFTVGDELDIQFRAKDYRSGQPGWEYRIEVGDSMEVRLNQDYTVGEYRVDVGDIIGIAFLNNWSWNATRAVRPDGVVSFDSVGDIKAAGKTIKELEAELTRRYNETGLIEGDPHITVSVDFSNSDRLDNMSRDLVVRPDGKIRLPVIKSDIPVAGLTVDEACQAVQREAQKVLQNPPVVTMVVFPYINNALAAMNGVYKVRPDGRISIPRLGEMQTAGYSNAELRHELAKACEGLMHNPVDPAVKVLVATGARIYVGGEVDLPGVYPLDSAPTALQAVIMARGPNDRSRLTSVLVIRRNPNGKPYVFETNLAMALKGHTENDIPLRSYDVVYVPKKLISRANLFVKQYIDDIVPFDNSLGVTGTYYLNEQRTRSKSRNFNYTTGVNVIPGGLAP